MAFLIRTWFRGKTNPNGWQVDYFDGSQHHRLARFEREADALALKKALTRAMKQVKQMAIKDAKPCVHIVWGVDAIATAIGLPVRAAYHKLSNDQIPGARKAGTWSLNLEVFRDSYREPKPDKSLRS